MGIWTIIIDLHYKRSIACSPVLGTHYPCSRPINAARTCSRAVRRCLVHSRVQPVYTGRVQMLGIHYPPDPCSRPVNASYHVHGRSKDALYIREYGRVFTGAQNMRYTPLSSAHVHGPYTAVYTGRAHGCSVHTTPDHGTWTSPVRCSWAVRRCLVHPWVHGTCTRVHGPCSRVLGTSVISVVIFSLTVSVKLYFYFQFQLYYFITITVTVIFSIYKLYKQRTKMLE